MSGRRRSVHSSVSIPIRTRRNQRKGSIPLHRYASAHSLSSSVGNDTSDATAVQVTPGTTIQTALNDAVQALEKKSVPEPEESAIHLLSHTLDLSWENGHRELRDILRLPSTSNSMLANQPMSEEQCNTFQSLLERRIHLEPLQYIVGQWDFHDLVGLKIKKPMLCPRPETEELVEFVLEEVSQLIQNKGSTNKRIRILDVGCGTGAIGLAIANRYHNEVQVVALDILPEAVELSNDNAKWFLTKYIGETEEHKLNAIYQAILCSAEDFTNAQEDQAYKMEFDVVVSNPPYIPSKDMANLSNDVIGYESDKALCGGDDGLDIIRHIVQRLPEWTTGNCWLEVDDSHPSLISDWLSPGSSESARLGVECVSTYKDFCGRDRFVKLRAL
jgi:release factor glutamine methyltransferase